MSRAPSVLTELCAGTFVLSRFVLGGALTPAQLRLFAVRAARYLTRVAALGPPASVANETGARDVLQVASMVRPLGPTFERTDAADLAPCARGMRSRWETARGRSLPTLIWTRHWYTCRHWDEATGDCGIYETRPLMCRNHGTTYRCDAPQCTRGASSAPSPTFTAAE